MVAATEWCRMCNLYSLARSQDEIRRLFKVETDRTGNLPPLPGIFPNTAAPIDARPVGAVDKGHGEAVSASHHG